MARTADLVGGKRVQCLSAATSMASRCATSMASRHAREVFHSWSCRPSHMYHSRSEREATSQPDWEELNWETASQQRSPLRGSWHVEYRQHLDAESSPAPTDAQTGTTLRGRSFLRVDRGVQSLKPSNTVSPPFPEDLRRCGTWLEPSARNVERGRLAAEGDGSSRHGGRARWRQPPQGLPCPGLFESVVRVCRRDLCFFV